MSQFHKRIIRWVLGFLILFCLVPVLFVLGGRALCKVALDEIASLTETKITDTSVDFNIDCSVVINGLVIKPRGKSGFDDTILKADRVKAHFGIWSILLLRPRLKDIVVEDFVLNAQEDLETGKWNTGLIKLSPGKGGVGRIPVIKLRRGELLYSKVMGKEERVVFSVPIGGMFGPDAEFGKGYSFTVETAELPTGNKSTLRGYWRPGVVAMSGGISSADIPSFDRVWTLKIFAGQLQYDSSDNYELKVNIKDLTADYRDNGESFESVLPKKGSEFFTGLANIFKRFEPQGRFDIELDAKGNFGRFGDSQVTGKVRCKGVSVCDEKLPYSVKDIFGEVSFTEKSARFNNLKGEHNGVGLSFNGTIDASGGQRHYDIRISSDNMVLDDDLYSCLSVKQKGMWDLFSPSPSSLVGLDYQIKSEGGAVRQSLELELFGGGAIYKGFPYPLSNLEGRISFSRSEILVSDVVSRLGGSKVTINGTVKFGDGRWEYDLAVNGENVPLDNRLGNALGANQGEVYEMLGLSGYVNGKTKVFTPSDGSKGVSFRSDIDFREARIEGEGFFGLRDASGSAVITPGSITLKDLRARYNNGAVLINGWIKPETEPESWRYCLSVSGEGIEVNDDLIESLPGGLKEFVKELAPEGAINLEANLNRGGGSDCGEKKIVIECLGDSIDYEKLPYRLKDVCGRVLITEDKVKLEGISGVLSDGIAIGSQAPRIEVGGDLVLHQDGLGIERLKVKLDDILLDKRVGLCLPAELRGIYEQAGPTGQFDVNCLDIKRMTESEGAKGYSFSGGVELEDCSFNTSPQISDVNAMVEDINGIYRPGEGISIGDIQVKAKSVRINNILLRDLRMGFGSADNGESWESEGLVADFYGGLSTGSVEFRKASGAGWGYGFELVFEDAQLQRFLEDKASSRQGSGDGKREGVEVGEEGGLEMEARSKYGSGLISGLFNVEKQAGRPGSLIGRCDFSILDMEVGKASPLSKLLYVLNMKAPKDFLFYKMEVDSFIKGNRVLFDNIDLSGRAVSLNGRGFMNTKDMFLDLVLNVRGKRKPGLELSPLQSLTEDIGRGVVRMDVKGNVYEPEVTVTTLPILGWPLGILGKPEKSEE